MEDPQRTIWTVWTKPLAFFEAERELRASYSRSVHCYACCNACGTGPSCPCEWCTPWCGHEHIPFQEKCLYCERFDDIRLMFREEIDFIQLWDFLNHVVYLWGGEDRCFGEAQGLSARNALMDRIRREGMACCSEEEATDACEELVEEPSMPCEQGLLELVEEDSEEEDSGEEDYEDSEEEDSEEENSQEEDSEEEGLDYLLTDHFFGWGDPSCPEEQDD